MMMQDNQLEIMQCKIAQNRNHDSRLIEYFGNLTSPSQLANFFDLVSQHLKNIISFQEFQTKTLECCGERFLDAVRTFLSSFDLLLDESSSTLKATPRKQKEETSASMMNISHLIDPEPNVEEATQENASIFDISSILVSFSEGKMSREENCQPAAPAISLMELAQLQTSLKIQTPTKPNIDSTHRAARKNSRKNLSEEDEDEDWSSEPESPKQKRNKKSNDHNEIDELDEDYIREEYDMSPREKKRKYGTSEHSDNLESSGKKRKRAIVERSNPDRWTKEENERLLTIVKKEFGDAEPSNWNLISDKLGTKTSNQCFQHWKRVLDPKIKKGPFTIEEEELLCNIAKKYNGRIPWSKVAENLQGRTDTQCRYQFLQRVKNQKISWSSEEDKVLLELAQKHNPLETSQKWQVLSEEFVSRMKKHAPVRSPLECKNRLQVLQPQ